MHTKICDQLGIEFPIFAFSHCRDVVAAVSRAGGFGVLGAVGFPPDQLEIFVGESLRLRPAVWRRTADGMIEDAKVSAGLIGIPTLILWGERDGIFDAATQQRLKSLLKNAELITYPDVGHAPNWEIPELVARDILAFTKA